MTTKEIAQELVGALAVKFRGIHHDYNLKEIEALFDNVLKQAGDGMARNKVVVTERPKSN